jgi:hypothetical protein
MDQVFVMLSGVGFRVRRQSFLLGAGVYRPGLGQMFLSQKPIGGSLPSERSYKQRQTFPLARQG